MLQRFRTLCTEGTEINLADGTTLSRAIVNKRGAIQWEMNAASMPDIFWPELRKFLDKMLLPGPLRTGIVDKYNRLIVRPWDDERDAKKKKTFLLKDLFGLPYLPMNELLEQFNTGEMLIKSQGEKEQWKEPMEFVVRVASNPFGNVAWDIFNHNRELYRQRITLKFWLYWLMHHFQLERGKFMASQTCASIIIMMHFHTLVIFSCTHAYTCLCACLQRSYKPTSSILTSLMSIPGHMTSPWTGLPKHRRSCT
jgi:hypothetical protein